MEFLDRTAVLQRPVVEGVVRQHADELAILWNIRREQARASYVALRHLLRLDNRMAAHQDGCLVAGEQGLRLLREQLENPTPAQLFATTLVAIDAQDRASFDHCVMVAAEALPENSPGIISALGWIERNRLSGLGRELLTAESPVRRRLGLAACRLHGVDPGPQLHASLRDQDVGVRAEALRTVGTIGRHEMVSTLAAVAANGPECQFWAAWSAVLLGDRNVALDALTRVGLSPGAHQTRAFRLALQTMTISAGRAALQQLAQDPEQSRRLIQGSGIVGDPFYVPWLVTQMQDMQTARAAGEAFSLITGTDLSLLDLERKPPEDFESGPTDNPDDPDIEMDPDDGLPWPDPDRIQGWWAINSGHFQQGTRYFMGAPVTREHCFDILKEGYQRQRILAAHYLCLLEPGTPLFNTSAPAWRQERLLVKMT